jgi:hypothetical protein
MKTSGACLALIGVITCSPGQSYAQKTQSTRPTLNETIEWLHGAAETESGSETTHIEFESKAGESCKVVIRELRPKASLGFWIEESFSLADIDFGDITTDDLGSGPGGKQLAESSACDFTHVIFEE